MTPPFWTVLLLCSVLVYGHVASPQFSCKPLPGERLWPSENQWQALNRSTSGRLLVPKALCAVCHPDLQLYNNASCAALKSNWTNSLWQESNAWTSMYNDETCLPSARTPCSAVGYPAYVIEARTTADVQAGVIFAQNTGARLIVKGTGHDVSGRSAGAGALSIWTHLLQGITINREDPVATKSDGVASVKLEAGMVWGDVYKEMAKANLTVIGGADPHVGIGGWVQGAGHGPLSSLYGLGADQVWEMEVVTADGQYRVINPNSQSDLFWAMRGGGPLTFAIMLSMTVKAYPKLAGYEYGFQFNTTASSDTFWRLVAHFSSRLPTLNDQGAMGYYYLEQDARLVTRSASGAVYGTCIFPNKSKSEVDAITKPLEASLRAASWAVDPIYVGSKTTKFDNFLGFWAATNAPESVGTSTRYVPWLFDRPSLEQNLTKLESVFRESTPLPWIWVGHLVAGAGVANARPAGGSDAVLPAWRRAYAHLVQVRTWTPLNISEEHEETTAIRDRVQPALRSLAPTSGAYANEGDPSNPNWKAEYFGTNYEQLLEIKKKWDPHGVFWCKPCVGFDEWDIEPLDNIQENVNDRGIGQDHIRLC
ncbi:hypothetical protein M409DRAFT_51502 [Zasmidium cellare ATCC 36951]|uniref:FAD-binding PCMH-type domain-containing protein n=1 Tax=Zasmidium cellare ATCC 36951 TaxID=1080233 RepID=A0A6A6CUS3_ZASCE|nr:uncharacterized protein M409DRAFT_51502 [Zasmidium cellare ATCC 36951]KAF2170463.1 hypothetical protein M409DRAFT_51502 [Zasmidium cellare ATCC 36951]